MSLLPRRFWARPSELRARGVLGINRRNADFVLRANCRSHYPRVDDKLLTKQICETRGIPVPATYLVIERHGDVARFGEWARRREFVIKPGKGSEGRGIIVVAGWEGPDFLTASGERLTLAEVRHHLAAILSGLYSLGGQPDRAVVEQRIHRHPAFESVSVGGTPDVRVVLYRCVPVMAMVRLPTRASRGRANLHQGAVAAGVHLATGKTSGGVCKNRAVDAHPDTGFSLADLEIPCWEALLNAAMDLTEALELGYVGVDFVLDAATGPVVLEANARPGLAIQLANRRGLAARLERVGAEPDGPIPPARRRELVSILADWP